MRYLHIFLMLLFTSLLSVFGQAQTDQNDGYPKETRKQRREEQKRLKAIELQKNREQQLTMVHDTTFVVEANHVMSPRGISIPVSASTNFFAASGRETVIQLAISPSIGINGLGGVTYTGTFVEYIVKEGKINKPIVVSGLIRLNPGTGLIPFDVSIQSNGVSIFTVSSPGGDRITLTGTIKNPETSKVFMGTPYFR